MLYALKKSYGALPGAGLPYAARMISRGRLNKPSKMLCVPASSEFRAEIRVALPQPGTEVNISLSSQMTRNNRNNNGKHCCQR